GSMKSDNSEAHALEDTDESTDQSSTVEKDDSNLEWGKVELEKFLKQQKRTLKDNFRKEKVKLNKNFAHIKKKVIDYEPKPQRISINIEQFKEVLGDILTEHLAVFRGKLQRDINKLNKLLKETSKK